MIRGAGDDKGDLQRGDEEEGERDIERPGFGPGGRHSPSGSAHSVALTSANAQVKCYLACKLRTVVMKISLRVGFELIY